MIEDRAYLKMVDCPWVQEHEPQESIEHRPPGDKTPWVPGEHDIQGWLIKYRFSRYRQQGTSSHSNVSEAHRLVASLNVFSNKDIEKTVGYLPDNSMSVARLWLGLYMHKVHSMEWDTKEKLWQKTKNSNKK